MLSHSIGPKPDTHRVFRAERHTLAHTIDTQQLRLYIINEVVRQEGLVVGTLGRVDTYGLNYRGLLLSRLHTHTRHLGRKYRRSSRNTVLHVDRGHIGIGTLLEEYRDCHLTSIRCRRGHIGHILHTVNLLLEGRDNRLLDGLGRGSWIGGCYVDSRRCYRRKLLDRQRQKAHDTCQHYGYRYHRREHRAVYKVF